MNLGSYALSPLRELGAYEALWMSGATFKTLADRVRRYGDAPLSAFVPPKESEKFGQEVLKVTREAGICDLGVRVHGSYDYPRRLRDAKHPLEILYFRGNWDLVETPSVAIVGTRNPSPDGIARTKKLVKLLVKDGFTIASGLARGIDTAAHMTAIEENGQTIAVIGTPLTISYPKENSELQERIAKDYLLVSQVPFLSNMNRAFFPERNKTMSALTLGTVIVEAGETSGTLIQARAALDQNRKLFILDSCFNHGLKWPSRLLELGAIRVRSYEDIKERLNDAHQAN
jgi:DNA processing protein